MPTLVKAGIVCIAAVAAFHYGYKAITGRCPCEVRRKLQFELAMQLLRGLEWEGYLGLDELEVEDG